MPIYVHLTSEKLTGRIRRAGVTKGMRGVFCLPVLPNYAISHQWLRELKRRGQRTLVGVYFWLPDDELVSVGRYNQPHTQMTAEEASAYTMAAPDPLGFEVIVPRSIGASEIRKVRSVPQVVGWRCIPDAHRRPLCQCSYCSGGEIKHQRRKKYYAKRFGARYDY